MRTSWQSMRFSRKLIVALRADRDKRSRNLLGKSLILLSLTAVTVLAFLRGSVYETTVEEGDIWQRETLVAPFDFAIYKTEDSLRAEQDRVRFTTEPVFHGNSQAQVRMEENFEAAVWQLDEIFEAYRQWRLNQSRARMLRLGGQDTDVQDLEDQALRDSARYFELRDNALVRLADEEWIHLSEDYVRRNPDLPDTTRQFLDGRPLYEDILTRVFELATQLNANGVLSIPHDSVYTEEIIIRNVNASTYATVRKATRVGLNQAFDAIQQDLQEAFGPEILAIPTKFAQAIFVPSLEYQHGATVRRWQEARRSIAPTRGMVAEGTDIVREGQLITPAIRQVITSLQRERLGREGAQLQWGLIAGQAMLALSCFMIFFLYLFMARRSIFDDNAKVLLFALLFAGIIGLFALAIRIDPDQMYAVPVVTVSVLLTVIFDSRIGLLGTLALALVGGLLLGYNLEFTLATLTGGTLAVFSVRDVRNRGQFFLSAGFAFAGYAIALVASWLFLQGAISQLWAQLTMAGISSFLVIMAYPLLWVFERAFGVTTDLRLLELSDTNRPILKELALKAPGTFSHSLQVASLAEAAATAIGANGLLTRVGALYHDIGKMVKPGYFVENQRSGINPHESLEPRASAAIISSHVTEGLSIGRRERLPRAVLNFIPMHHGTTRIEYFFQKALRNRTNDDPVGEGDFRYPGPRPRTRETAILMLTDGVEAASRSLDDPTQEHLESIVDTIFDRRLTSGQLEDTPLTFRDLRQIRSTLLLHLSGIYHLRVKYPGQEKN